MLVAKAKHMFPSYVVCSVLKAIFFIILSSGIYILLK